MNDGREFGLWGWGIVGAVGGGQGSLSEVVNAKLAFSAPH